MSFSVQEPGLFLAILLGVPLLLFLYVFYYVAFFYAHSVDGVKVPRGNFWIFPLIGETIQAFSVPPLVYFSKQMQKYGDTFTTHLLGTPTILTKDIELSKWVYSQTNKGLSNAIPKTTRELLGRDSIFFMTDDVHKRVRNLMKGPLSINELVGFIPTVDKAASDSIATWKSQKQVRVYQEIKKYVLYIAWSYLITINTQAYPYMDQMLANVPGAHVMEKLAHLYYTTQSGMMALPLLIPGTNYYKAMKARSLLQGVIKKVIADRQNGLVKCNDFLQSMLLPMEDGSLLTDDQIMDNIFSLLGASDATTSGCVVWMVKNICEHPKVYEDLKAEHDAIKMSKAEGEALTNADLKKMTLTLWTMNETLRLVKVVGFFTGRYADEDVLCKGVAIPKNWKIGLTHGYHRDPAYFPEPDTFNPYRFEKTPPPFTFTPWGGGCRTCPGKELAKIEILTFMYHLITNYSFERAEPDEGTTWHQFPYPSNFLPINITPRI
ncbi:hypothetical protein KC19_11G026900 [Ceratodon purpureus]|uniref:Cytochrome P450 n=2 Tax=Ceratodon purpureus TaxID=3225 RepID=A0A8T0GDF1_CERPU|nr:hypothetical protein KC19_11G026900 [Ceratodon purpureus]